MMLVDSIGVTVSGKGFGADLGTAEVLLLMESLGVGKSYSNPTEPL